MSSKHAFKNISFIGGGRVTHLLLKGFESSKGEDHEIIICDPNPDSSLKIEKDYHGNLVTNTDNSQTLGSELIFIAVHPPVMDEVLSQLSGKIDDKSTVISLLPTKSIAYISEHLAGFNRIVRMIPNAPSAIGQGYNPVSFSETVTAREKEDLLSLFAVWGDAPVVDEKHLEAYAILTGMGPTYFWFQWEIIVQLASKFGLDKTSSRQAVYAMIKGSNELLFLSDLSPSEVVDLIPVHPIKDKQEEIASIFTEKLTGLFAKLRQATN